MQVALPDEINEVTCADCGAGTVVNENYTAEVNAESGWTNVWLLCADDCGWLGIMANWQVSRDEYEAIYGHVPTDLLLPGEPFPLPHEAWDLRCPNKVGRWRKQVCGANLIPDLANVFYYDEFTSTARLGFRCDVCQYPVREHRSWPLTPEQHLAIFGRAAGDYRPECDPEDPDDFEAQYSIWRTTDRWGLTHFRNVEDLAACEDFDLLAMEPGDFTIKHWPTGAVWDAPEFVAQHQQVVDAAYESDGE